MKSQLSKDRDMLFIFKRKMQMKKINFQSFFMIFFIGAAIITTAAKGNNLPDTIPKGWRAGLNNAPDIVIGTDTLVKHSGKASGFMQRSLSLKLLPGSANLLQSIAAEPYRNKRVRLSVYLKTNEIEFTSGRGPFLYFRVDGQDSILTFANTVRNLIVETTDWTMYHITLDVPETSVNLDFGVVLMCQGTIWIDDYNLEVVDQSIPSDDWVAPNKMKGAVTKKNYQPNAIAMNLGFEDR